ncbi:MAG TPA: hypothetical protein VF898_06365 [Chloroflexota bacterium]
MKDNTEVPEIGERIVVRTPDRREYRGHLLAVQRDENGFERALVRLDTGWETSYPLTMVSRAGEI